MSRMPRCIARRFLMAEISVTVPACNEQTTSGASAGARSSQTTSVDGETDTREERRPTCGPRKRILFCVSRVVMGGVAKVLLQYLEALERLGGYDCGVFSLRLVEDTFFLSFFREHGVTLHVPGRPLPEKKRRGIFSKLALKYRRIRAKSSIRRAITELAPHYDVLIEFEFPFLYPYIRHLKQSKIAFCHVSYVVFSAFAKEERLAVYDRVVCLSHAFERDFKRHFPKQADKIVCIHNPVGATSLRELACRGASPVKGPYFVAVQRLEDDKDVHTIIRAFRVFRERHPEYRLVIVGDGFRRPELEQLAAQEVTDGSIIFTGSLENPYPLIRDATALILASTQTIGEGLGQVLVEAQILGVSAVSSDVPSGPAEVLLNGEAGYLFDVGNPASLAQALQQLVEFPSERESKVRRATEALARFAPEQSVRKLLQLTHLT